jgi:hypothetical protein
LTGRVEGVEADGCSGDEEERQGEIEERQGEGEEERGQLRRFCGERNREFFERDVERRRWGSTPAGQGERRLRVGVPEQGQNRSGGESGGDGVATGAPRRLHGEEWRFWEGGEYHRQQHPKSLEKTLGQRVGEAVRETVEVLPRPGY